MSVVTIFYCPKTLNDTPPPVTLSYTRLEIKPNQKSACRHGNLTPPHTHAGGGMQMAAGIFFVNIRREAINILLCHRRRSNFENTPTGPSGETHL